jgi:hypothetical protein
MSVIEYGIVVAVSVRAPRHARFGLNSDCHPARSPIRAATFLDPSTRPLTPLRPPALLRLVRWLGGLGFGVAAVATAAQCGERSETGWGARSRGSRMRRRWRGARSGGSG